MLMSRLISSLLVLLVSTIVSHANAQANLASSSDTRWKIELLSPAPNEVVMNGEAVDVIFEVQLEKADKNPNWRDDVAKRWTSEMGVHVVVVRTSDGALVVDYGPHQSPSGTVEVQGLTGGSHLIMVALRQVPQLLSSSGARFELGGAQQQPSELARKQRTIMVAGAMPPNMAKQAQRMIAAQQAAGGLAAGLGGGGGLAVEHLTFGADEVTRKDLGVREWMLPPKPSTATQPLPKIKCRLARGNEKHVVTMAREASVSELAMRARALFGGTTLVSGNESEEAVLELRDVEGYAFVYDDVLEDLADSITHTLVVNVV